MVKEYSTSDLLSCPTQYIPYYAGTFEETEDVDVEWPHRHSYYSLVWVTQGSGFYVIDFNEYNIQPGRLFIVNPKQIHNWDYSENSAGYILVVDISVGIELNIDCSFPFIDMDNNESKLLESVFKNIISAYKDAANIKIDIQYIYQVIRRYAKDKNVIQFNTNSIFDNFKQYILNNLSKLRSIAKYVANAQITIEELNAAVKTTTGISAKQYILDLKITEAKRLLIYSDLNMNEISFHIGFEDSSYFARIFKKKVLISPTEFSSKYRKHP